jgi:beta-glucosidase
MDPLLRGKYPQDVIEHLGADAPKVRADDAALIAQPLDFLGVNYYYPITAVAGTPFNPTRPGVPVTDMGWEVAPERLTDLLLRIDRDYELPPLMITENGAAFRDQVVDGGVQDEDRRLYIETHLEAIAAAIEQGVDVRGYFVWSLLDNFEWASGYSKRFGIYYVDYATQVRILKRSGQWYRSFVAATAAGCQAAAVADTCPTAGH